jgi:hypothetical protein
MGFIERALGLQVPPMSMRSTAALDTEGRGLTDL